MISFLIALTLYGNISNQSGRLGIVTSHYAPHYIHKIEPESKANGLLQVGDKLLYCDGYPGTEKCVSTAGEIAHLEIERDHKVLKFDVERVHFDD